jgi:hypothetical protein
LIFKAFIALFNAVGGRAQIGEKVRFVADQLRSRLYCYGAIKASLPSITNVAPGLSGAKGIYFQFLIFVICVCSAIYITYVIPIHIVFLKEVLQFLKRSHPETLTQVVPLIGEYRKKHPNLDPTAINVEAMFAEWY